MSGTKTDGSSEDLDFGPARLPKIELIWGDGYREECSTEALNHTLLRSKGPYAIPGPLSNEIPWPLMGVSKPVLVLSDRLLERLSGHFEQSDDYYMAQRLKYRINGTICPTGYVLRAETDQGGNLLVQVCKGAERLEDTKTRCLIFADPRFSLSKVEDRVSMWFEEEFVRPERKAPETTKAPAWWEDLCDPEYRSTTSTRRSVPEDPPPEEPWGKYAPKENEEGENE